MRARASLGEISKALCYPRSAARSVTEFYQRCVAGEVADEVYARRELGFAEQGSGLEMNQV
jgi:hypothetical protein